MISEQNVAFADSLELDAGPGGFAPETRLPLGVSAVLILGASLLLWAGIWQAAAHLL